MLRPNAFIAMKLLMISGDRSVVSGKKGAFWYTLEEFSKLWDRIDVITPAIAERNQKPETRNQIGNNVFFHPSPHGLAAQARWIRMKGAELIAEHHHDVMTVQEYPPFYNGIGACKLHVATGVPYVLEVHHIVGAPRAASVFEWIGRITSRWQIPKSAHHTAAVRTVNVEVAEILERWGIPGEKIHIVPSFYLDADVLRPDPTAEKKYDLVFCARLVANKGLSKVLRAMAKVPSVRLLVIGDGPERTRCEALSRSLGISDRVTFVGWLPDQQAVVTALHSARVFVMNSSSEGGPRSALEAMACGLPVIATRVGVMPDVIVESENGMFTTGDADDLAEKIKRLLTDTTNVERMGQAALRITERFERKKLIREYAEFLKGGAHQ